MDKRQLRMDALVILALVWITIQTFSQVGGFEFLSWDDEVFLLQNPIIGEGFGSAFSMAFGSYFFSDYLPVTLMSFWTDNAIAGLDPAFFHWVNLLLHVCNIVLLWCWLRPLVRSQLVLAFIALIFAVHPLQVESVVWVSERKGLLCTMFTILSLLAAQRLDRGAIFKILYPLCFFLALLSKTSTIFTPLFLIVLDRALNNLDWRTIGKRHIITLTMMVIAIFVRIHAYAGQAAGFAETTMDLQRILQLPLTVLNAIGFYIEKFMFPVGLSAIYPNYSWNPETSFRVVLAVFFFALAYIQWRRRKDPLIIIGTAIVVFFFLPILQIVPRLNYVNDRYAYIPVIGLTMVFAGLIRHLRLFANPMIGVFAFGIFALPLSRFAEARATVWKNNLSLWTDTVSRRPEDAMAHLSLGSALEKADKIEQALSEFRIAAERGRHQGISARALSNIALIRSNPKYIKEYNLEIALRATEQALQEPIDESGRLFLRYNHARLVGMAGQTEKARELCIALLKDVDQFPDLQVSRVRELTRYLLGTLR